MMAQNCTLFSQVIENLTSEESEWWKARLDSEQASEDGCVCEVAFEGGYICLYAYEHGDLERLAGCVQDFLAKFRPRDCFGLTFAFTCSKPRPDEFGGGAVFVTARGQKWLSARVWLGEQRDEFLRGGNQIR